MNELEAARGLVREAGGEELLDRLDHLDAAWTRRRARASGAKAQGAGSRPDGRTDVDVAIAGGGLWLLLAPLLAARGLRVAVFDRGRAGVAHREWNASGPELRALVDVGLLTRDELDALIVARYRVGLCRFHGGGTYPVLGVLDHAIDAGALLGLARRKAESLGVTFFDRHIIERDTEGPRGVHLRARGPAGEVDVSAALLVDARGATSPYATADLVCPTVGGCLAGLEVGEAPDQVDFGVGEILVTIDGVDDGRQHVWEGFPGRPGELTTYLFYYARAEEPVSLVSLYARFFRTRPDYKRGAATLVRPTFGLIPGWSRLTPPPRAPGPRVVLVGDAAARHSALTLCGFGATLRSLAGAAGAVVGAIENGRLPACIVDDAPIHALTGALARVMASRRFMGDELNTLLDAAFAELHAMPGDAYARMLRDEIDARSFVAFLRGTAARHPAVWRKAARGIGLTSLGRWGLGLARELLSGGV